MNLLVILLSLAPMMIGLFSPVKIYRSFTALSLLFSFFFYCLPLYFAMTDGRIRYGDHVVIFSNSDTNQSLIGLLLFSLGFAASCLMLSHKYNRIPLTEAVKIRKDSSFSLNTEYFLLIIMIIIVIYLYSTDFYTTNIKIRSGQEQGSYRLSLGLSTLYFVGCYYVSINMSKLRYTMFITWYILTIFLALSFLGRAFIMLLLALPIFHYVKNLKIIFGLILLVIMLFYPLVINGKQVVSLILNNQLSLYSLSQLYQQGTDLTVIAANLSHPLISFYYADNIIDSIGYRYFWDIPQGFLFYLRLVGLDFGDSLTYINTEFILFKRQSIIPPGYIAFGYIQAGYIGIFITGMLFFFLAYISKYIFKLMKYKSQGVEFLLAFITANTFYIGEVRALVLTYLLPLIILWAISYLPDLQRTRRSIRQN